MVDTSYHMTAFQRRRKLVFRVDFANILLWSSVCEVVWVGNQKHRPTENHKQMCVLSAQFFLDMQECEFSVKPRVSGQRSISGSGAIWHLAPSLSLSLWYTLDHWTRHTAWYTLDSGSRRVRPGTLPKCLQPHFVTLNTKLCNMHDLHYLLHKTKTVQCAVCATSKVISKEVYHCPSASCTYMYNTWLTGSNKPRLPTRIWIAVSLECRSIWRWTWDHKEIKCLYWTLNLEDF